MAGEWRGREVRGEEGDDVSCGSVRDDLSRPLHRREEIV